MVAEHVFADFYLAFATGTKTAVVFF